jgi:hypothetical protein
VRTLVDKPPAFAPVGNEVAALEAPDLRQEETHAALLLRD